MHDKKKKKNWAVFAAVVGFMALIWIITMVRIAGASPLDVENAFPDQRASHAKQSVRLMKSFDPLRAKAGKRSAGNEENGFIDQRTCHLYRLYKVRDAEIQRRHNCDI